jgi:GGDEF domain-containing protein
MKLSYLVEAGISPHINKTLQKVLGTKRPIRGPGVYETPPTKGEVGEEIEVFNFQKEWEEANHLQDAANNAAQKDDIQLAYKYMSQAVTKFKRLSDANAVTGLRDKSFSTHKAALNQLHIVIDLDNLKMMNARLGHEGADKVLRNFAKVLKHYLEDPALHSKVFHIHGDEFNATINLSGLDQSKAQENIKEVIHRCKSIQDDFSSVTYKDQFGKQFIATCTIGIGFDLKSTDHKVESIKTTRKALELKWTGETRHLIVMEDVKEFLNA